MVQELKHDSCNRVQVKDVDSSEEKKLSDSM
jgi:hypothetical protein